MSAEQWLVGIGKAVYQKAKVIAMDEPTAALSQAEVDSLFTIIRTLTSQGIGVIFVSHKLDEVMEICDEITVFKDGKKVLHAPNLSQLTKEDIITAIAGHKVDVFDSHDYEFDNSQTLLKVVNLSDRDKVKDVSFSLKKGEILGITGLVGAGRTEVVRAIYGANEIKNGEIFFEGIPYKPKHPYDAVKRGIVIIPEDRRKEGLITTQSVDFNINLPTLEKTRSSKLLPFINRRKSSKITNEAIKKLIIKAPSVDAQILTLSGGNQQKVVIGKWLQRDLKLIIMDEPTQGVDVGARAEIYKLIQNMAEEKKVSFIVVTSDVEELPGLCDRVLVMVEGKISGELVGKSITKEAILHLCYKGI